MTRLFLLLFSFVCFTFSAFSQRRDFKNNSFHIGFSFPNISSNEAFDNVMQGLIKLNSAYRYSLKSNVYFELGANYSYFALNEFKTPGDLKGGLQVLGPSLAVGYEKYFGKLGIDFGLKTMYNINAFKTNNSSYTFDAIGFEPGLGFSLRASEQSSIRLQFSMANYGFSFRPHMLDQDNLLGLTPDEFKGGSWAFCIGFGYAFYF